MIGVSIYGLQEYILLFTVLNYMVMKIIPEVFGKKRFPVLCCKY
jgi:hypothetical protein